MSRKIPTLSKSKTRLPHDKLTQSALSARPKMAQYIGFFTIGYVLASAIFMIIQTKVTLNSYLVIVLSIIIGAYVAVYKFIKHQQRALNRGEINRLVVGGVAAVWISTGIYLLVIWFWLFDAVSREVLIEMTQQQPLPLLFSLMVMMILTLVSARISIWALNRLLNPQRKMV